MAGLEDLEDDIELPIEAELKPQEQPRKLSRLQKARNVVTTKPKGLDTPEGEARSSLPEAVLKEDVGEASEDEEEEEGEGAEAGGEEEEEERGEAPIAPIWDEEDEIEQYFKERAERGKGVGEESDGSGSDSEGEDDADKEAPQLGDNPTLEDLQAETQRIMREVAVKDRLGKGQKIEIKPLTGIVAKLKERRALAIARAPKASFTAAPSFEDALAAATDVVLPLASPQPRAMARSGEEEETNPFAAAADAAEAAAAAAKAAATAGGGAAPEEEGELDDDLEVLSDDDDGQFNVVPLPQRAPQQSPHTFNPFANTRDVDEFEDEPLVDDGLNSDDDSDTESERSWEVRRDEEVSAEGGEAGGKKDNKKKKKTRGEKEEEEDTEVSSDAATSGDGDASAGDGDMEVGWEGAEKREEAAGGGEGATGGAAVNPAAKAPPSAAVLALAASDAVPEHIQKAQRKYLDMEAELSDEEGGGAGVSEDEEENALDDNGELADLITHDKMRAKDAEAAGELHVQWQRQKDAQDLQEVMRGVKNGFRRRNAFGLDDGDEERNGRWRRARADGEDDDFMGLPGAGFEFPKGFQDGDDEPCEDEAMLQKAQQQRLLAGSQVTGGLSPGSVPLDEDSQAVLGLLARGGSESQHGGTYGVPPVAPPSRLALELKGADLRGAGALFRAPSFLGRQPAAPRSHQNAGGAGLGSGRSFVFGRSENSNSAIMGMDGSDNKEQADPAAEPVSFANLRQMVGSAGMDGDAGKKNGGEGLKRKHSGSTLVSRLKSMNGAVACGSQESLDVVSAVCQNIAQGPTKRHHRR